MNHSLLSRRTLVQVLAVTTALTPFLLVSSARGAVCSAKSGQQSVPLVELYTSEGCSSCPPADRWMSATFAKPMPRASGVALAFHVDYWDQLGWKDRFAAP